MKRLRDAVLCTTMWSKLRGLMFSPKRALVFVFDRDERVPLHMWFVFFPIDVLYLDRQRRVVEIKKGLRPFAFYAPRNKARYVVEIPGKTTVKVGDVVTFK